MNGGQRGEVNTDPKFIYGDDLNVIAYRLGIVETDLKGLDVKLDRVINEYPTQAMLGLILGPINEKIKDLEDKREKDNENKVKHEQQIKYTMIAAIAGPIATILVGIIAAAMFGGISGGT